MKADKIDRRQKMAFRVMYLGNKVHGVWGNSLRGLRALFVTERAFRIDLAVFAACVVVVLLLPLTWLERALMIFAAYVPILAEIVNTGMEKTIDRISPEYHHLSGRVKDIGSALVMMSFVGAGICWLVVLVGMIERLSR